MSNKISIALILKRKSCICCQKLCRSLFPEAHGICGLKEIFEGVGTFLKKFLQTSLFHLEKINLIRFIKTLIKGFAPHPLRLRLSTFSAGEKALKPFCQATLATFPFGDGFRVGFQFDKFLFIKKKIKGFNLYEQGLLCFDLIVCLDFSYD